jgi:hypothetical protein
MSFRLLASVLGVALCAAGCGKTVYQSHEGHYCSIDDDEDPFYRCARDRDLVCIQTYSENINNPDGGVQKTVPIYLCREACNPGDKCPNSDDICCPGKIVGIDYNKMRACVPPRFCEMPPPVADAAPRDTLRPDTTAGDAPREAGPGDAGDAGAGDVPVDAPQDDTGDADAGAVDAVTPT